jgi:hypothetical protein
MYSNYSTVPEDAVRLPFLENPQKTFFQSQSPRDDFNKNKKYKDLFICLNVGCNPVLCVEKQCGKYCAYY